MATTSTMTSTAYSAPPEVKENSLLKGYNSKYSLLGKKITCPNCSGTGYYSSEYGNMGLCSYCGGTGKIYAEQ